MSSDKLYNIEKTENEIIKTIIINTIKMLINRGLLTDTEANYMKSFTINDDLEFKFKEDKKTYLIKFINISLTTIRKEDEIIKFLNNNINSHKIIILKDKTIVNKVYNQFMEFPNTEVFTRDNLMINIVDHDIIPLHIPLNDEEKNKVLNDYGITLKNLPQMFVNDPIAKYYNLKVGDIVKILRPSITGGYAIVYRRIVYPQ